MTVTRFYDTPGRIILRYSKSGTVGSYREVSLGAFHYRQVGICMTDREMQSGRAEYLPLLEPGADHIGHVAEVAIGFIVGKVTEYQPLHGIESPA